MSLYTIVDYFGYDLSPEERMKAIRTAGFDGVILLWADYFDADYKEFPRYAAREGLFVENTHGPYKGAEEIWNDSAAGADYTEQIMACIRDCREYGIPTMVMHAVNGMIPLPEDASLGVERFRRIDDLAEQCGVNVAVENQGNPLYLDLVFDADNRFSDRIGFCFDSGHENFYSPNWHLLSHAHGEKLMALHLHDNNGKEDTHALPFTEAPEGWGVDWTAIRQKLQSMQYKGAVALETLNKGYEHITDPVEFLRLALERAKMIL